MSCPMCGPPESVAIAAGIRAGVSTLVVITAVVVAGIVFFAWRLWLLRDRNA